VGTFTFVIKEEKKREEMAGSPEEFSGGTLMEHFDWLRDEMVRDARGMNVPLEVEERTKRLLEYTLPGGKLNRGAAVLWTVQHIFGGKVEKEVLMDAVTLGWAIEWVQTSFLVADDLMDGSTTRRGKPCWYKKHEVGMQAVNDAMLLMTQVDRMVMKRFGNRPEVFMKIHQIMQDTILTTELGQMIDMETQPLSGEIDLSKYTMKRYLEIVTKKTAFYSFFAPVALGMICADVSEEQDFQAAKDICMELGIYFQIQDDFLDCFGTPEQIGKIGTDIVDGKCSWLVVQALQKASEEQAQILHSNYAKKDASSESIVKQLYAELELRVLFEKFEEDSYTKIQRMIESKFPETSPSKVPGKVFQTFLSKIFKRKK